MAYERLIFSCTFSSVWCFSFLVCVPTWMVLRDRSTSLDMPLAALRVPFGLLSVYFDCKRRRIRLSPRSYCGSKVFRFGVDDGLLIGFICGTMQKRFAR